MKFHLKYGGNFKTQRYVHDFIMDCFTFTKKKKLLYGYSCCFIVLLFTYLAGINPLTCKKLKYITKENCRT